MDHFWAVVCYGGAFVTADRDWVTAYDAAEVLAAWPSRPTKAELDGLTTYAIFFWNRDGIEKLSDHGEFFIEGNDFNRFYKIARIPLAGCIDWDAIRTE